MERGNALESGKDGILVSYTKTIVCFANSRKLTGRCVAGREWDGRNFGAWIRPIGACKNGELYNERYYEGWQDPKLLDVIEMTLLEPRPSGYQTENHLVDPSVKWRHLGRVSEGDLVSAVERPTGPIWVNGESTGNGRNDKIRSEVAVKLPNSLMLIQPEQMTMVVGTEGAAFGRPKRKVRGYFALAGHEYVLSVTDSVVEGQIKDAPDGSRTEVRNPVLCISLGEIFEAQNACYKLVASVIHV